MPKGKDNPATDELMIAITAGDTSAVHQALSRKPLIPSDALFDAVKFGDAEMVRLLLNSGADINVGHPALSPLARACGRDKSDELVSILIDGGADVTAKVHRDALSAAINAGRATLAKRLIDLGALRKGQDKGTLLADAAAEGLSEVVAILLADGADPNSRLKDMDNLNPTALTAAAAEGHIAVVKQLLAAGADPTLPDKKGRGIGYWVKKFRPANAKAVLMLFE